MDVKQKHPVFKSITIVDGGDSWDYQDVFRNAVVKTSSKKEGEAAQAEDLLKEARRIRKNIRRAPANFDIEQTKVLRAGEVVQKRHDDIQALLRKLPEGSSLDQRITKLKGNVKAKNKLKPLLTELAEWQGVMGKTLSDKRMSHDQVDAELLSMTTKANALQAEVTGEINNDVAQRVSEFMVDLSRKKIDVASPNSAADKLQAYANSRLSQLGHAGFSYASQALTDCKEAIKGLIRQAQQKAVGAKGLDVVSSQEHEISKGFLLSRGELMGLIRRVVLRVYDEMLKEGAPQHNIYQGDAEFKSSDFEEAMVTVTDTDKIKGGIEKRVPLKRQGEFLMRDIGAYHEMIKGLRNPATREESRMRLITLVNTSELFRTSATGVTGLIIVSILDKPVLSDDDIKQLESFPMIPTGASKANRSLNKYLLDEGLIESDQSKVDARKLNVKHYEDKKDKKSLTHLLAPHIASQEIQFVITSIKEWLDSDKVTLERILLLRGQKTKQVAELENLVEAKAKQHAARFKVTFTSKK